MLKDWLFWLGIIAILLTAAQGTHLWREERRKAGQSWIKLIYVLGPAVVGIATLYVSTARQRESSTKAETAQKALTDSVKTFSDLTQKDKDEISSLRAQLGEFQGTMGSLSGKLDKNYQAMQPKMAQLQVGFIHYLAIGKPTIESETTIKPDAPGVITVSLDVLNTANVNALNPLVSFIRCTGCQFAEDPGNPMLQKRYVTIPGGGRTYMNDKIRVIYPIAMKQVHLLAVPTCDDCPPPEQHALTINVQSGQS